MIKEIYLIEEDDAEVFATSLSNIIAKYQGRGLIVEVQYQPIYKSFSALIIGKEND
jgi:hypothetical protein